MDRYGIIILVIIIIYYYYRLYVWDSLLLRLRLRCTTIKSLPQPTIIQSTPVQDITLSLLGHWLLPLIHTAVMYDAP